MYLYRLWDQICPKNISDKVIGKMNIKIVITILQCAPVPNSSQFGELQFLGPNLPKKHFRLEY